MTGVLIDFVNRYKEWLVLHAFSITDVVEIIIISVAVYYVINWVQLTRAWTLFKGVMFLLFFALLAAVFHLDTISYIMSRSLGVGIIAVIIIFQPELRRALEQLGRRNFFSNLNFFGELEGEEEFFSEKTVDEIVEASYEMGKVRTGALIVIEHQVALGDYERTGITVDGVVTSQLLINIFEKNTPLHDGAVIIRFNHVKELRKLGASISIAKRVARVKGVENEEIKEKNNAKEKQIQNDKNEIKELKKDIKEWDYQFVGPLTYEQTFHLINAGLLLELDHLHDLACAKIAAFMKGKSPEDVNKEFTIECQLTQEEAKQLGLDAN